VTSPDLAEVVAIALAEDLADGGDRTAAATVPAAARCRGELVARERGVAAGIAAVQATYAAVDPDVAVTVRVADGDKVAPGDVLVEVAGPTRSVLTGERTALNLLSHLSGVATATSAYVEAVQGTDAVIRDTRKTLPGLRALQKDAVRAGGGVNHRMSLSDGILVKDNHALAAGGVGPAARAALEGAQGVAVQVEVDSLDELAEALDAGVRTVLIDNFTLADSTEAVARCRAVGGVFVEASGGVTLDTVADIARTGVDAIAVGALTHSVRALDIGLDLVHDPEGA
jgi:nicotinate-nucleotide pyrophosphorylase (carboxylating)